VSWSCSTSGNYFKCLYHCFLCAFGLSRSFWQLPASGYRKRTGGEPDGPPSGPGGYRRGTGGGSISGRMRRGNAASFAASRDDVAAWPRRSDFTGNVTFSDMATSGRTEPSGWTVSSVETVTTRWTAAAPASPRSPSSRERGPVVFAGIPVPPHARDRIVVSACAPTKPRFHFPASPVRGEETGKLLDG